MPETNNTVQFGLSEVAIAMKTGEATYDTPIMIPGAVTLSADPEGSSEKFYADDCTYYSVVTNDGYTGELEVALVPDEVKVKVFGWEIDKNGALVEIADAIPKPFALLFRIKGDAKKRYSVFYNVGAERPKNEHKTTEDKANPATEKMPITMTPEKIGSKRVTKLSIPETSENAAVIGKFYDAVYLPDFDTATPAEGGE
ncbi:major tail protein [Eggerthella timonensis]|uniref:major tail protein n=1 Tax=Eggerthella timonensis TaxID=1871008 RepID=UPI000C75BE58|nr:major tail protein [Eggerthella timonensis]